MRCAFSSRLYGTNTFPCDSLYRNSVRHTHGERAGAHFNASSTRIESAHTNILRLPFRLRLLFDAPFFYDFIQLVSFVLVRCLDVFCAHLSLSSDMFFKLLNFLLLLKFMSFLFVWRSVRVQVTLPVSSAVRSHFAHLALPNSIYDCGHSRFPCAEAERQNARWGNTAKSYDKYKIEKFKWIFVCVC